MSRRHAVSEAVQLDKLTAEEFTPFVDSLFDLQLPNAPAIPLKLTTVEEVEGGLPGARRAFSLLFAGPREPILPQNIYSLGNATLGLLDIFLVPIGLTPEYCRYQAIFT